MANRNLSLNPPPYASTLQDSTTMRVQPTWLAWFRDIYSKLSAVNYQVVTGATNLNLDSSYISLDSSLGSYSVTLDAPTLPGIPKIIELVNYGGHVTLALTNIVDGTSATTCTWTGVGNTLVLLSRKDKWMVTHQGGVTLS